MGVPFQKVALDIVGPLPRTKHGNKYLLTTMCYYTKFPEAIPLKRVDTMAVVDAMCEVFFSVWVAPVHVDRPGKCIHV